MPGMYQGEDYDLAGFCVGVVERERIIDGSTVTPGDVLVGMASSGPHSNGYSLIRRVLERSGASPEQPFDDQRTLGETLLTATRIYVPAILELVRALPVHALCHVTGGGLPENLPRVLPEGLAARIDLGSWRWPAIFDWLQRAGGIAESEMYRTFNCGVGMVACVPEANLQRTLAILRDAGEVAWELGRVVSYSGTGPRVEFQA
jgi:phosphoribosylformylglycinamidine cyclo-ligase